MPDNNNNNNSEILGGIPIPWIMELMRIGSESVNTLNSQERDLLLDEQFNGSQTTKHLTYNDEEECTQPNNYTYEHVTGTSEPYHMYVRTYVRSL